MILRITPNEAGTWEFRLNGGRTGQFTATASSFPGFIEVANVHHFRYSASLQPHLWMGDIAPSLSAPEFDRYVETRASQHFNHIRITVIPTRDAFPRPDAPNQVYFADLDRRLILLNSKGITADLVIAPGGNAFIDWFPQREQRERVVRYLVARYGAFNITWQGLEDFETYTNGRQVMQEIAAVIEAADQYHRLQSCATLTTSAPLFEPNAWMKYLTYRTTDPQIGAVEHQLYPAPAINDFRATASTPDSFRHQLWRASMNGQYPESAAPSQAAAAQMAIWYQFFASTRHWELEPFFDVEGGVALALEDVEYIVYVEQPGPVTIQVEKHNYEVEWLNPLTGESLKQKPLKEASFSAAPPDNTHDWVLHISREGHKASLLKSYKFESHEVLLQEVETNSAKIPFEIAQPGPETISLSQAPPFAAKLTRQTRATRRMQYIWTGEIPAGEQSYRIIGTGPQGTLVIPRNLSRDYPALLHVRLVGINANGKIYELDRNYQLTQ